MEIRFTLHPADPLEIERRKLEERIRKERIMANLKPLMCDGCGEDTQVSVYESDLNGSYFYCLDCVAIEDED